MLWNGMCGTARRRLVRQVGCGRLASAATTGQVVIPIPPAAPRTIRASPRGVRRPAPGPSEPLPAMSATTIAAIRATPVTVPLEAPLLHSNGAHWGRFVRTIVEVETADGYVGLGEMGGGGEDATRAFAGLESYLRRPRRVRARGDALRDLQSDREPVQQPHAAARGDRVRVPRHHRARSSACPCTRCSAASCATPSSSRATCSSATPNPRPDKGEVRTPEQLVADARGAEGAARLHVAQAEGRRLSAGARARVLSRARRMRCPASASATTPTARCRSPTRSRSAAASRTSATTTSRTRSGACRSSQRLKEFVPLPIATNTVVVNFEQLAANVATRAVDVDPARHHVLGRHPALHQGRRRLRDDGHRRRRAQLGRARHPARDDAAHGRRRAEPRLRRRRALPPPRPTT